jgi:putative NADH-flavin reductase
VKLVATPGFPAQYKAKAEKGGAFLDLLRRETELNWTFISPSALFTAGERTGKFRLGMDRLLTGTDGKAGFPSRMTRSALADELENRRIRASGSPSVTSVRHCSPMKGRLGGCPPPRRYCLSHALAI